MSNYIEEDKTKIQKTPGGSLCQVFGNKEGAKCSIALVTMDENSNGLKHYHDNITEIYLFSKGEGSIIINEHENIINSGDCYIIPAGNTHYIKADTNMEFACICTPPWTEEHEFIVNNTTMGNNISPTNKTGIIQVLSSNPDNYIKLYEINNYFKPTTNMKNYRRVYYFIQGNGLINIDNKNYDIKPGYCYEVKNESNEYIETNEKIKFVLVCENILNN